MAYDGKISFVEKLQSELMNDLTATQLKKLGEVTKEVMIGYEINEIRRGEEQDDLLDIYLNALNVECRSRLTIDRYRYVIKKLMAFTKVPSNRITVYHLRAYLAAEKDRGISDTTLESDREVFSSYFNWLQRESLINRNPVSNLGVIKCAKREKKTYTEVDLEKLNRNCTRVRDRAIIAFLQSTGCRIGEALDLNRDSVNLDALECVVFGKGSKERTVYLSEVAGMFLREYLNSRTDDCDALFINKFKKRLKQGGVRYILNTLAAQAGVEHVHPHKFRRTLATNLCKHGMPIQEVSHILGHEKIDTTMKYVVLSKDGIKSSYKKFT